ncbi:MAG: hypothetical protein J6W16_01265 [Methanobrevibacter sp.]|nr:hypothetical protein [Methanobrevibacter sp.]
MELIITDNMIIQFITGGTEYTLSKMVFSDNGVEHEVYNSDSTPSHDYSQDYFTIEMLDGSNATLALNRSSNASGLSDIIIAYSINDGTWKTVTFSNSVSITGLNQGDKIRFKWGGQYSWDNKSWAKDYNSWHAFNRAFSGSTTYHYKVYGNLLSLFNGDNFLNSSLPNANYVVGSLFKMFNETANDSLVSAKDLIFPDTMPDRNNCYYSMFANCTALEEAPEILPAMTLGFGCYDSMFTGCTSLTKAPILPALTMRSSAYQFMFDGCTSLNYVKCLASEAWTSALSNWLNNVSSIGTFVKNALATNWPSGKNGIPSGWTVQDA